MHPSVSVIPIPSYVLLGHLLMLSVPSLGTQGGAFIVFPGVIDGFMILLVGGGGEGLSPGNIN